MDDLEEQENGPALTDAWMNRFDARMDRFDRLLSATFLTTLVGLFTAHF